MRIKIALVALAAAAIPAQAGAQVIETVKVRAGLGGQIQPDFLGSNESEWAIYPSFKFTTGDKPFGAGAPDDSFGFKLFSSGAFSAGPAARLRSGRDEDEINGLDKVGRTIEVGGFAQYDISESVRVRAEARQGVGGHGGLVGNIGADKIWRDGDNYVVSLGPRVRFASADFNRAYFGVPADASTAALAPYRPSGGLYAIGAITGFYYGLGDSGWGIYGYGRYDRLVGDAARSPIVRDEGSRNQFSAGVGLSHTFTLKL